MRLLFHKVFEAILCATSRDLIFTRESSESTATPNALDNHTQAVQQLFWPLLAATKELPIPQGRSDRGGKCRQNGPSSGWFAHLQQSHCEQSCQAIQWRCQWTGPPRGQYLSWGVREESCLFVTTGQSLILYRSSPIYSRSKYQC